MRWNRQLLDYIALYFIAMTLLLMRNMLIDDLPDFKLFFDVKEKNGIFSILDAR